MYVNRDRPGCKQDCVVRRIHLPLEIGIAHRSENDLPVVTRLPRLKSEHTVNEVAFNPSQALGGIDIDGELTLHLVCPTYHGFSGAGVPRDDATKSAGNGDGGNRARGSQFCTNCCGGLTSGARLCPGCGTAVT